MYQYWTHIWVKYVPLEWKCMLFYRTCWWDSHHGASASLWCKGSIRDNCSSHGESLFLASSAAQSRLTGSLPPVTTAYLLVLWVVGRGRGYSEVQSLSVLPILSLETCQTGPDVKLRYPALGLMNGNVGVTETTDGTQRAWGWTEWVRRRRAGCACFTERAWRARWKHSHTLASLQRLAAMRGKKATWSEESFTWERERVQESVYTCVYTYLLSVILWVDGFILSINRVGSERYVFFCRCTVYMCMFNMYT